jgi:hypothetical protein|tara:strand:- start:1515 stop:1892 length:378 start_codon:yes stop_codon:yes gene_type:complete
MVNEFFQKLSANHPFITVCTYANLEYVGIIQNRDDVVTTLYDYGSIVEQDLKILFLELGENWWWESNRLIPINIFLRDDWSVFRPYLKTFNNKGLNVLHGPTTSLNELAKKRIKRRSITLVKKML